jgi:hypothetical protein
MQIGHRVVVFDAANLKSKSRFRATLEGTR